VTVLQHAPTATGPTARTAARSARVPVLLGGLLVLALVVTALVGGSAGGGRLDPDSHAREGSRALAELLRDRGVEVRTVGRVEQARGGGERTTVLVPFPAALTPAELRQLSDLAGELVVVAPDDAQVAALELPVAVGGPVPVEARRPACDLPAAQVAGEVEAGGFTYRSNDAVTGCYASGGRATLLRLDERRVTLLGDGDPLTNAQLDQGGSAALGLGLLGTGDEVRWLLPETGRPLDDSAQRPLSELLPRGLLFGLVQLLLAAAVLALWRARRLGRVVTEPLPVVVRAAESVEGRSRLYRAAGARGQAAEALRTGARDRLGRRLGLAPDTGRAGLVGALAARTGRDPAQVDGLLYGAAPPDDAALVRLADGLDELARAAAE
jgi:hypothetical protein